MTKQKGMIELKVDVVARDADGTLVGEYHAPDLATEALAQLIICNILDGSATIADVGNTGRSITANDACTAPFIVGGTTSTAATFTDYALGDGTTNTNYKANGNYAQSATVGAIASNTFTVTATISNASGSTITYKEVGMAVTCATYQFLIAHDIPNGSTGYPVSTGGTLAVTYTATFT